jgi:oligopeptidase B
VAVSPDGRILAYSVDRTGREVYALRFRDLGTGEDLPDTIPEIAPGVTWASDSQTLFWSAMDASLRPWRIHRHQLGVDGDPVVFQEDDERFRLYTWRSRSGRFVFLQCSNAVSTELHLVDADRPTARFRRVYGRQKGLKASVDHQGDRLLLVTNDSDDESGEHDERAVNYKLVEAPLDATSKRQWREIVPHALDTQLVSVDAFEHHWVLTERHQGQLRLRVHDVRTSDERVLELPEPVHVVRPAGNPRYRTTRIHASYTSMTTPRTTFLFDLDTGARTLLKETPVPGYDRTKYRTTRLEATAADGTAVPISVVHRHDVPLHGNQPTVLYGYGSYGMTVEPEFVHTRVSLLDRGVVYAIAHIRGGGFLGRPWYKSGKLGHKRNTFDDFVACARHLQEVGVTSPDKLAIMGGSAGGMLVGAAINLAPELFHCALAAVPFVDVVTTMLDESLPLTAGEWDEWGDPREPEAFSTMLSYSPYDNVRSGVTLPNLLVISGLNDPRVQFWEPTKWVAKLRAETETDVILKTHMGAGHAGRSGRYGYLEDKAFEFAWVLGQLDSTARLPEPA